MFTTAGLERMERVLGRHVGAGTVPGAVALVDRGGETHVVVLGAAALDGPPLDRDSIFRISSMTKPVVAVAALTLVEDCVLRLEDPVDDLLPELAGRRVLTAIDAPLDSTVPAARSITVRDLFTSTMGFGQLMADPAERPVVAAAQERGIALGPPAPAEIPAPDEWLRRLGELPLMSQPGERWAYDTDLLAFGRMLLAGGGPVLSRRTVAAMTTDQLTPEQKQVVDWVPFGATGWGLGIGLATGRTGPAAAPGRVGWDGGLGTSWSCDRTEDLVGCVLTQALWTSPAGPAVAADFWTTVYTALD